MSQEKSSSSLSEKLDGFGFQHLLCTNQVIFQVEAFKNCVMSALSLVSKLRHES